MIQPIGHPDALTGASPNFRAPVAPDLRFAEQLAKWDRGSFPGEAPAPQLSKWDRGSFPGTPPIEDPASQRRLDAREAAEQFVAAAFLEPMLAQVRENNMGAGAFAPNAAERRFGPLLDQRIAHNVVRGAHFPLVDRIEHQILGKSAAGKVPHDA